MAASTNSGSSSPSTSTPPSSRVEESELERKLFSVYTDEVRTCDENGQSTQHIGDEWMRREIRKICGFDVSDRWIKLFRRKYSIRYFSGRRHADKTNKTTPLAALDTTKVKTSSFLKERRVLRTSRKEYVDVDARVQEEIVRRQTKGERLTNPWIREYAQFVAAQLYPQMSDGDIHKFFDANWLYRFKRRYSVELKPRSSEELKLPSPPPLMGVVDEATRNEGIPEANYYTQMLQFHHYFNFMSQTVGGVVAGEGGEKEPAAN